MKELKSELKAMQQNYRSMTNKRNSLQRRVDYYTLMRAVIVEVKVAGNDLSYYVNYLVKNHKG